MKILSYFNTNHAYYYAGVTFAIYEFKINIYKIGIEFPSIVPIDSFGMVR